MKILVIDDEFVARTTMVSTLSKFGKCDVAVNGREGLELFVEAINDRAPFDLVTIDIDMPGMNGIELLERMLMEERKLDLVPSKKLVVSAVGVFQDVLDPSHGKCHGFIVKPVKGQVLVNTMLDIGLLESKIS